MQGISVVQRGYSRVYVQNSRYFHCSGVVATLEAICIVAGVLGHEKISHFNAQVIEEMTRFDSCLSLSLTHAHTRARAHIHMHSLTSNESGLLIQSNCNRAEYLCGPPLCGWQYSESNPTKSEPFSCIAVI